MDKKAVEGRFEDLAEELREWLESEHQLKADVVVKATYTEGGKQRELEGWSLTDEPEKEKD